MTEGFALKEKLQDYWNTQGSIYDFGYESDEECAFWRKELHEIIGDGPKKILDVGTGTGFLALNLSALGYDVTGLDFSQDMMKYAREKMKRTNLSWHLVTGDAEHPDFPDNIFDVVICRYVLWTLPHPKEAIAEWVRVVRPGGKLIIIDGKRKRTDESLTARVNQYLWKMSRSIFCGYNGIAGHDLTLEKNLPHYEGIGAEEVISYFQTLELKDNKVKNLYALHGILKRNLPWLLRFGYQARGVLQIIWAEKN